MRSWSSRVTHRIRRCWSRPGCAALMRSSRSPAAMPEPGGRRAGAVRVRRAGRCRVAHRQCTAHRAAGAPEAVSRPAAAPARPSCQSLRAAARALATGVSRMRHSTDLRSRARDPGTLDGVEGAQPEPGRPRGRAARVQPCRADRRAGTPWPPVDGGRQHPGFVVAPIGSDRAVAYGAWTMAQLAVSDAPARLREGAGRYPHPVALLARIGVHLEHERKGLGAALSPAVTQCAAAISEDIGCRGPLVHAGSEGAVGARSGLPEDVVEPHRVCSAVVGRTRASMGGAIGGSDQGRSFRRLITTRSERCRPRFESWRSRLLARGCRRRLLTCR